MKLRFLISLITVLLVSARPGIAQKDPVWDDTQSKSWPQEAAKISILSSNDGKAQPAYFYKAPGDQPKPLVVSLHTWSGDFRQKDTLVHFCIKRGYHYIHPHFRGPNHTEESLGSELVVSDIDDAIEYALRHATVDPDNIHVIGVSGGGHATVLTYMKSKHAIRSFSAYVGIYNLIDWYYESEGRNNKYAGDIAAATSGDRKQLNLQEAKRRSPYFMSTPVEKRAQAKLNLYVGIHDGYTGSVPVSQTLHLYNKVVQDFQPNERRALVPAEFIQTMVRTRALPGFEESGDYLGRKIIYRNQYNDLVRLIVFDGGHEMPPGDVLAHVPSQTILTIGDSNGAMAGGWVDQLKELRPNDRIINTAISGNTIGFDNLNRKELNTLRNIEKYIGEAEGKLNAIVIMLGTNDCKAEFDRRFNEVPVHMDKLVKQIKRQIDAQPSLGKPEIFLVSPPPYGDDSVLVPKYHGGARKADQLSEQFASVARNNEVTYIETHRLLKPVFSYLSKDGVHLTKEGHVLLAAMINEKLETTSDEP